MRKRNIKMGDYYMGTGVKVNTTAIATKQKKYFATGDNQNVINVWPLQAKLQPCSILSPSSTQANQTQVEALTFSYSQQQIIAGSNRGIINIWDLNIQKISSTLRGHSTAVNSFAIFKQQQARNRLASGSYDTNIKLWDLRTKNNTTTLKHHTKQINCMDISPDSNLLISGSQDCSIKLWDLRYPEKLLYTYNDHSGPVNCIKFNPEEILFASGSSDKTAKYFRCQQNQYNFQSSTDLGTAPITAIQFDFQGKLLYTAGNDNLKVWNMAKSGLLIDIIQSSWKGVQDICMMQNCLNGIAFNNNTLSIWVYLIPSGNNRVQRKIIEEDKSFVLPPINPHVNRLQQIRDVQNNINAVVGLVNNLGNNKQKKNILNLQEQSYDQQSNQFQKKKSYEQEIRRIMSQKQQKKRLYDLQKKREQQQRRREEQIKKRQDDIRKKQEKQKRMRQQRQKRDREQKQRRQRQQYQRRQRQRERQIQREKLREKQRQRQIQRQRNRQKQRQLRQKQARQKQIQQQIEKQRRQLQIQRFNQNMAKNYQQKIQKLSAVDNQVQFQNMEQSINISMFMGDQNQKQKFKQFDLISQIIKNKTKYDSVMNVRKSCLRPILNWWNTNNVKNALYAMIEANISVVNDAIYAIINNPKLKSNITPDAALTLIRKSAQLMNQKQPLYVKNGMTYLNQLVLMYKDQIIKLKSFSGGNKVDITRQERIAKYDRLIDQFLMVFKMQRLIKCSKQDQTQQLNQLALILYKNLQELLRKIIPKKQGQLTPC